MKIEKTKPKKSISEVVSLHSLMDHLTGTYSHKETWLPIFQLSTIVLTIVSLLKMVSCVVCLIFSAVGDKGANIQVPAVLR